VPYELKAFLLVIPLRLEPSAPPPVTIDLADGREVKEKDLGEPIMGELAMTLPAGSWQATFMDPTTGGVTATSSLLGGETRITLPKFRHYLVIRLRPLNR